jgi:dTDP-4-amino-4,6-dideoxygalactose transaminase
MKINPTLSLSTFLKTENNLDNFLKDNARSCFFFSSSRIALREGLRAIGLGSPHFSILVPSYICDAVIPFIKNLGLKVIFYNVLENLDPDILDIQNKISDSTKAIILVNYFGFPQKIDSVKRIAAKRGLYVIEDNAHSFLSKKGTSLLGTIGDIGFSSLYKTFPTCDGAVLYINKATISQKLQYASFSNLGKASSATSVCFWILYSLMNNYDSSGIASRIAAKLLDNSSNAKSDMIHCRALMSPFSLRLINSFSFHEIKIKRRQNFQFYLDNLKRLKGCKPVHYELDEGTVPWVFPVIAEKPKAFVSDLLRRKVPVFKWPALPPEISKVSEFSSAHFLAEHLICMPVHQGINTSQLKRSFARY